MVSGTRKFETIAAVSGFPGDFHSLIVSLIACGGMMTLEGLFHQLLDARARARGSVRPRPLDDRSGWRMLGKVAKIMVETRRMDTHQADPCWLLVDAEGRILFVLPIGAARGDELLNRIGDARGFDRAAIKRAMRSKRNARFTVWQRDRIADNSQADQTR